MTQDYLACIVTSTKDKSISVASYRTLGPATCVRLPDPLAQPLVRIRMCSVSTCVYTRTVNRHVH